MKRGTVAKIVAKVAHGEMSAVHGTALICDLFDVIQPLTEPQEKAMDLFVDVCNEPVAEGQGKEFINGLLKMKAFMAGRVFEFEKAKVNEV